MKRAPTCSVVQAPMQDIFSLSVRMDILARKTPVAKPRVIHDFAGLGWSRKSPRASTGHSDTSVWTLANTR